LCDTAALPLARSVPPGRYSVEALAADTAAHVQGFEPVGRVTVRRGAGRASASTSSSPANEITARSSGEQSHSCSRRPRRVAAICIRASASSVARSGVRSPASQKTMPGRGVMYKEGRPPPRKLIAPTGADEFLEPRWS